MLTAPQESVALQVAALMSDGQRRDVTRFAVYETSNLAAEVDRDGVVRRRKFGETTAIVRFLHLQVPVWLAFLPERRDFAWSEPPANNRVDRLIFAKLRTLRVMPSEVCGDTVFLRRIYLDLLGILPTADEARAFVADAAPDKRDVLIDRLLMRPEFAELWALNWSDVLRNEEKVLDAKGVDLYYRWIRDRSLNRANRSTNSSASWSPPAAAPTTTRRPTFTGRIAIRTTRAETAARLFLGVRLQCAQCHNHPFDRWTQDDYYSWSALFARIDYKIVSNERRDDLDKHEFNGEQIVLVKDEGELDNPRSGAKAAPQFLGAELPRVRAGRRPAGRAGAIG